MHRVASGHASGDVVDGDAGAAQDGRAPENLWIGYDYGARGLQPPHPFIGASQEGGEVDGEEVVTHGPIFSDQRVEVQGAKPLQTRPGLIEGEDPLFGRQTPGAVEVKRDQRTGGGGDAAAIICRNETVRQDPLIDDPVDLAQRDMGHNRRFGQFQHVHSRAHGDPHKNIPADRNIYGRRANLNGKGPCRQHGPHLTHHKLGNKEADPHAPSFHAGGSSASISTKAMRQTLSELLTQAWLVPCCTMMSPVFMCTSESSSSMSISPSSTKA